jgi:hypothetical protein
VGATYHLGERTVTAGRDAGNFVQVVDDQVSRRHLQIRWDGSGYQLLDLKSQNGTFVNEQRVLRHVLAPGDRIRLGGTVFEFEVAASRVSLDDFGLHAGRDASAHAKQGTKLSPATLRSADGPGGGDRRPVAAREDEIGSVRPPRAASAPRGAAASARDSRGQVQQMQECVARVEAATSTYRRSGPFLEWMLDQIEMVLEPDRLAVVFPKGGELIAWGIRRKRLRGVAGTAEELVWPVVREAFDEKRGVVYEALPGRWMKGIAGTVPPFSAVAAPMALRRTMYGVLYADVREPGAPPLDPQALSFLERLGAAAADVLLRVPR